MSRLAYHTPPAPASGAGGALLLYYGSPAIAALLRGALNTLCDSWSFEQVDAGNMSPDDSAQYFRNLLYASWGTENVITGAIFPYATASPPPGTLACDGAQYDRVDYPVLYAALDSAFILDADTFVVPDLRGSFARGASPGDSLDIGDQGGSDQVTLTEDNLPSHSHSYTPPIFNVDLESPGAPDAFAAGVGFSSSTGSTGGDQAFSILPPFVALRMCIVHG